MTKNLIIVESPEKAKTIKKFLGEDFSVIASVGHIRNIVKKTKDGTPPIDTKNGYKTTFEVDTDKKKVVTALKKAVREADVVWLGTDEDREGEAIAWHLCEVLKLDPKTTKRIVFHEVTKEAIENAIKNPRVIDQDWVKAQQARQILDRLVGFELSPVVWKKVPGGKSAGRVQSPAVRLVVEREREIEAFESSSNFKVVAEFLDNKDSVKAELPARFKTEKETKEFLQSLIDAKFTISDITTSSTTRNPAMPFTTSTLQQDANSKLGFSAKATMASAQKLYQTGKITYMRTDSVNLSRKFLAETANFVEKTYGKQYSQVRTFRTKSANAQEAHEAIRPINIVLEKASSNDYEQKLYNLIRRRTLACQMAPARLEKTTATIKISTSDKHCFEAKGEVVLFDGFLKVYSFNQKEDNLLPTLQTGDELTIKELSARQVFARPPARYTEGSLVKKLEELGIGRPSTYATILNTIQVRGYVEKGDSDGNPREVIVLHLENNTINRDTETEKTGSNKGKLIPAASGEVVSDFLTDHFQQIVDYGFTAKVENDFDKIASGQLKRNDILDDFYWPFHKLVEESSEIDRSAVAKSRKVGIDPKSGKVILARFGRFGPLLQLGETSTDKTAEKPRFAPLPNGTKIDTVTLEQALHAFELPRIVGKTSEGDEIKANIGRFGPYIQVGKLFVSIKPLDPHTITLNEALDLYAQKLKTEAEKNIADFGDGIKILNGRFGPYITDGTKNVKIPKDDDPTKITHEEAQKRLKEAPTTKRRRFSRKRAKK